MSFAHKILNAARADRVTVTIEKENGEISDMIATLNPENMPADKAANFAEKVGPSYAVVWSLDRAGFRNIAFRNVVAINGERV